MSIFSPFSSKTTQSRKYSYSRIRDHLANERTYLAWMRTAIALMGFGVVIMRLRAFHPPEIPRPGYGWKLGLLFSLLGLLTVLLSTQHYKEKGDNRPLTKIRYSVF